MNALALTFGLLTALPVRRLPRTDRRSAGAAVLLAPLTVVPTVGVLVLAHLLVVHTRLPAAAAAVLVVGTSALLTRAMHLDGLADTADGLSATGDASARRRAMKASDTGPSGVAALVLVLLLQVTCLAALLPSRPGVVLAGVGWLASRHALAWCCAPGIPAATSEGLGALVAGSVPRVGLVASTALLLAVATLTARAYDAGWWTGPVVMAAGLLGAAVLVYRCVRKLGGVTGDVLGAVVETALAAALVAAALTDPSGGSGPA